MSTLLKALLLVLTSLAFASHAALAEPSGEKYMYDDSDLPPAYLAPGHDKHHDWYQHIQRERADIGGCCDSENNDCGPVEWSQVRESPQGLEVQLEDGNWHLYTGEWYDIYTGTPEGKVHVCRKPKHDKSGFHFYCLFYPKGGV